MGRIGAEITLLAMRVYGKDKYGRTVAAVILPDGTNVNETLVKEGWCQSASVSGAGAASLFTRKGARCISPISPCSPLFISACVFTCVPDTSGHSDGKTPGHQAAGRSRVASIAAYGYTRLTAPP